MRHVDGIADIQKRTVITVQGIVANRTAPKNNVA